MDTIGPCTFAQLPQHYRDLFESGRVSDQVSGGTRQFLPYTADGCALPLAALLGVPFLVIAVSVVVLIMRMIYQNPGAVVQFRSELTAGVQPFIILSVLSLLLIGGTATMLKLGLSSLADVRAWIRTRRGRQVGAQHYGLLLDGENLVMRHGNHFEEYTCAFLPRSAITECFVAKLRVEGAKFSRYIDVVKIWYKDDALKVREMVLKEHFDMPAAEMQSIIQRWRSHRS